MQTNQRASWPETLEALPALKSHPEDFSGDEVSSLQHHPAHLPASSPQLLISTSLSPADTPTSIIPALTCVTARSAALQVTGNCDTFQ